MDDSRFFRFSPSVWLLPALLLWLLWAVYAMDAEFNLHLADYGVVPRTLSGLAGIFVSPLVHGDLGHLASNSAPLFILTAALVFFYRRISLKVLVYGWILSGLITWMIGRPAHHIGASGLVYVLVSFVFFKGIFTRYYRLVALSFAVVSLYGGMIWYMFPGVDASISWEAHLGGFISGLAFALYFKTPDYHKAIQYDWQRPDYDPSEDRFMQRFDENGQFVNPPPPEPDAEFLEEVAEPTADHVPLPLRIVYRFRPASEPE